MFKNYHIYKYLFKYFWNSHGHNAIMFLNSSIHLREKKISVSHEINFMNSCSPNYIVPGHIALRISTIESRNSSSIDLPFRRVEILYFSHVLVFLVEISIGQLRGLSTVHLGFISYVTTDNHINLSVYWLPDSDYLLSSRGLECSIPPRIIEKIDIFNDFQILFP